MVNDDNLKRFMEIEKPLSSVEDRSKRFKITNLTVLISIIYYVLRKNGYTSYLI